MDVLAQDYTNTANLSFQYHAEAYQGYMNSMNNRSYSSESLKSVDISFSLDISYNTKEELIAQLKEIDEVIEDMVDDAEAFLGIEDFFQPQDTAERLVQNIYDKSEGDPLLIRSGREGLIQGYQDAFKEYANPMPQHTKDTIKTALEMLDELLHAMGTNIIDQKV